MAGIMFWNVCLASNAFGLSCTCGFSSSEGSVKSLPFLFEGLGLNIGHLSNIPGDFFPFNKGFIGYALYEAMSLSISYTVLQLMI